MNPSRPRSARVAALAILAVSLSLAALPSYAASTVDSADGIEDVVQALEIIPETGPIADASVFTKDADGSLTLEADGARLRVGAGDSPSIALSSDHLEPVEIASALPGPVNIAEEGSAVFSSSDDYSTIPLPHEDGSVQIVTVLEGPKAPERFDYDFSSTSEVELDVLESGTVVILDASGEFLGGVAAPWAFDANGVSVPTHFEATGSTLTQVVDHRSEPFAYPISADPYLGQNLWIFHTIDIFQGAQRVNLRLSSFGNQMRDPVVLINYGWPEALGRSALMRTVLTSKTTMRQQFDCHAFGAAFAGDWNLEKFRVNRTVVWSFGVAVHHCNWNTATQY